MQENELSWAVTIIKLELTHWELSFEWSHLTDQDLEVSYYQSNLPLAVKGVELNLLVY